MRRRHAFSRCTQRYEMNTQEFFQAKAQVKIEMCVSLITYYEPLFRLQYLIIFNLVFNWSYNKAQENKPQWKSQWQHKNTLDIAHGQICVMIAVSFIVIPIYMYYVLFWLFLFWEVPSALVFVSYCAVVDDVFLLLFISYRILSACCCVDSCFSGVIVCVGSVNGGANSYYQLLAGQLCCAVFCVGQSTMICVQFFVLVFPFTILSDSAYGYILIRSQYIGI